MLVKAGLYNSGYNTEFSGEGDSKLFNHTNFLVKKVSTPTVGKWPPQDF